MVHVPINGGAPAVLALVSGRVDDDVRRYADRRGASQGRHHPRDRCRQEFQASSWWRIGAPHGTSAAVVKRLNAETNAAANATHIKGSIFLNSLAASRSPSRPEPYRNRAASADRAARQSRRRVRSRRIPAAGPSDRSGSTPRRRRILARRSSRSIHGARRGKPSISTRGWSGE